MSATEFFRNLELELKEGIDKILHHPFVKRIEDGWLNKAQLQYFAKQYSVYCRYFPRFLAAAAANIPDDQTRLPIIENLWEEHGEGKLAKSHRILFNNFAYALGVTKEELNSVTPLATTEICCSNLLNLCQDEHFLVSLGALGPGTEFFTNDEYQIIENGLKKYDFLSADDIEFWTVHISLDEDHYSELVGAVEPWATTVEHRYMIRTGAKRAIDLELLFWEGLEDNLPGR
ncbi:MAG: iron-containing redox enzyme family protein [Phaeodactylibacter sp.]|nr:iron-containing redox enzyme family protein [Phaeodactylibacter sp.]